MSKPVWILAAVVGLAGAGLIDYYTGIEYRVFPFYYLAAALAAWRGSRVLGALFGIMSGIVWGLANGLAGIVYSAPEIWGFNVTIHAASAGAIGVMTAELRRRLEAERLRSRLDGLTSLPNRRALLEHGELMLAVASRHHRPLTIAYLDLDNFKAVNDRQGHSEGDAVLCAVATVLDSETRAGDLAARLGGDEFALMMAETDPEQARAMLGRLCQRLNSVLSERGWPVTVSIGAVCLTGKPTNLETAFAWADAALYDAKRGGKSRVNLDVTSGQASQDDIACHERRRE